MMNKGRGGSFAVGASDANEDQFSGREKVEEVKKNAFGKMPENVFNFLKHEYVKL